MAPIDHQTIAVTVFPDRARVTRRGNATIAVGVQTVTFRDLPLSLLPDSVRAAGRGTARTRLLGVNARQEHYVETPAEAARELERRIEALEDQDAVLASRLGVLETERANLAALGAQAEMYARGLALRGRTPEEIAAIFTRVAERTQQIETAKLEIGRERRTLAREADRLRRELNTMRSARPKERWSAEVEVDCREAGTLEIDLSYMVTNAGWQPLYDLRLDDAGLEVTYLSQIRQSTGEDWRGVAITLSTALPSLSLIIPELDPWYIEPERPRPLPKEAVMRMAIRAPSPAPQAAGMMAEEMQAPATFAADVAEAEIGQSGAAVTYRVGGSSDIPGDGTPRKTTIAVFRLAPKLDYVTAPRLADAAYRRATVKNDTQYMLLPGSAQLFEGDEYLGATALELTSPGQEFELVLGSDERVRVKRELKAREVDKRFMGDRRRLRYAYEIEVENLSPADQIVTVRDQLPVSRHEEIKVKLEFADPKVTEQTELNLLEWKLALPKGQKRTLRFEYSVEAPRAMEVRGLA